MTPTERRAFAAIVLTERADEMAEAADRICADNPLFAAGIMTVVEHLRAYIKHRLPFEYEED